MRVLHLYSDHRLTGPAETVLEEILALQRLGVDVLFACGRVRGKGKPTLLQKARQLSIPLVTDFVLRKHFDVVSSIRDAPKLAQFIREERIDVLHCHLLGDHVVGAWARQQAESGVVVRSVHSLGRLFMRVRAKVLTARLTDAIIVHSRYHMRHARHIWALPPERVLLLPPPLNLQRFRAQDDGGFRTRFGFGRSDVVAALVGRLQRRRRVTLFLEALSTARKKAPQLKGLIIGRGTKKGTLVDEPLKRLGLENAVCVAGYFDGDDYPRALAACDFAVYLAPGSDETAKALRELLAMGKPVIAGKIGMLPELVEEGGVVTGLTAEDVAEAMANLAQDERLRRRLGEGARRFAETRLQLAEYARRVLLFYERLLTTRA